MRFLLGQKALGIYMPALVFLVFIAAPTALSHADPGNEDSNVLAPARPAVPFGLQKRYPIRGEYDLA